MPSVTITVSTDTTETSVAIDLPDNHTQDVWNLPRLEATLAEVVARVCRSYGITPPTWDE